MRDHVRLGLGAALVLLFWQFWLLSISPGARGGAEGGAAGHGGGLPVAKAADAGGEDDMDDSDEALLARMVSDPAWLGPAQVGAVCQTSRGPFRVAVTPELAPNGTAFFLGLVKAGYWDQGISFWRVNNVITQFGVSKLRPRDNDRFLRFRKGALRDEHPTGGVGSDAESVRRRKADPWRRGTLASIGGFHFVAVIKPARGIGINRHDAPLGTIPEEDMVRVFDRLYKYPDSIDNKRGPQGPDQGRLMREGPEYMRSEFPLGDWIRSCQLVDRTVSRVWS